MEKLLTEGEGLNKQRESVHSPGRTADRKQGQ